MAKNVTINIGNEQQSFQGTEILRLQQVGSTGMATFVDSDIAAPVVLYFDESGAYNDVNSANIELIKAAISAGAFINVQIAEGGIYMPAIADVSSSILHISAMHPSGTVQLDIAKTTSGSIRYRYSDIVAEKFSETGTISATQAATAEWVKTLINESIVEGEW